MSPPVLLGDRWFVDDRLFPERLAFCIGGGTLFAFIIAAAATYYFCKGKQINLKPGAAPPDMMTVPAWWVTRHNSSNAKVMAQQSPPVPHHNAWHGTSTLPHGSYLEKTVGNTSPHPAVPTVFPACCGRV